MSGIIDTQLKVYDDAYIKFKYKQYCDLIASKLKNHEKPHDRRYKQGFFVPRKPQKCLNIMATKSNLSNVFNMQQ